MQTKPWESLSDSVGDSDQLTIRFYRMNGIAAIKAVLMIINRVLLHAMDESFNIDKTFAYVIGHDLVTLTTPNFKVACGYKGKNKKGIIFHGYEQALNVALITTRR